MGKTGHREEVRLHCAATDFLIFSPTCHKCKQLLANSNSEGTHYLWTLSVGGLSNHVVMKVQRR